MRMDPFALLNCILKDAAKRVPGSSSPPPSPEETMQRLEAEKREEWLARGVKPGLVERALAWARETARGWVERYPESVKQERMVEIYPSFLQDAEERYIRAIRRAMYEPEWKER